MSNTTDRAIQIRKNFWDIFVKYAHDFVDPRFPRTGRMQTNVPAYS